MYICKDCGYIFEEPVKYSEDRTPGGVFEGGSFIEYFTGCPLCAGAYEEAEMCDECERYFLEDDLTTAIDEDLKIERQYCKECYKEIYGDDEEWTCN